MNKTNYLIKVLKIEWLSAFKMDKLVKSSSADRLMRFIRNNPPKGMKVVSRVVKATKKTPWHLEYRLVKK